MALLKIYQIWSGGKRLVKRGLPPLTLNELKQLLHYNPKTGILRWRVTINNKNRGTRAGTLRRYKDGGSGDGYRMIVVRYGHYLEHRLIWFYMTGRWPRKTIDHINGQRDDNRWKNLREATHSQNAYNAKPHKDNALGLKGVSYDKTRNKYRVVISMGYFDTIEKASKAYNRAAKILFGVFARLNN